jgi:pyridoxamine 5'-phosphate oxidase
VVFRGWFDPHSQLKFITDIRSAKAMSLLSLNLDPGVLDWAEACWYFPKTREQFRVSGTLNLITATCNETSHQQARQETWQQMSDNGRIQFVWPTPGADRSTDPQAFAPPAPDQKQPSENFCLLLLIPLAVDHLELRGEPQNRCLYTSIAGEWSMAQVNP